MSAEPDPLAIEIEIKIPKPTLRHHLADGNWRRGFGPFIRNLIQTQPSSVFLVNATLSLLRGGERLAHKRAELLSSNLVWVFATVLSARGASVINAQPRQKLP
jgi:hypothetical protein